MKTIRFLSGSSDKRKNQFALCMVSISLLQSIFLIDNKIHIMQTKTEATSEFLVDADRKESIPDKDNSNHDRTIPDSTKIMDDVIPCYEEDTAGGLFTAPFMCDVWPGYYTFLVLMHGKDEVLVISKNQEFKDQAGEVSSPQYQESELNTRKIQPVTEEQVLNADTTLPDTVKNYPVLTI